MAIKWVPTTEKMYYEMLGVLPPASWGNDAFQVGEPSDHRNGQATFASFRIIDGQFFTATESLTFREFKAEVENAVYCYDY
jgi:hypothetical protein